MKNLFIIAMCICLMTLEGCNKASADSQINEKAKAELAERYPDAVNVKWTSKNGYDVAKFNRVATRSANTGYDFSVWFNRSGQWCMTESEISYNELPEAVKTAFQASEYADWKVDDIDKLERNGMETFYVIEVETRSGNIEKEADLYYSEEASPHQDSGGHRFRLRLRGLSPDRHPVRTREIHRTEIPWSSNHRYRI